MRSNSKTEFLSLAQIMDNFKSKNTKQETLKILDLNEGVIYSGKNSWNGTKRGKLVRQGWYIYYIQVKLKDGTTYQKRDRFYLKH